MKIPPAVPQRSNVLPQDREWARDITDTIYPGRDLVSLTYASKQGTYEPVAMHATPLLADDYMQPPGTNAAAPSRLTLRRVPGSGADAMRAAEQLAHYRSSIDDYNAPQAVLRAPSGKLYVTSVGVGFSPLYSVPMDGPVLGSAYTATVKPVHPDVIGIFGIKAGSYVK